AARKLFDVFDKLQKRCENVIGEAKNYVLTNCYSGPEYQFSTGCSVFFPWNYLSYLLVAHDYRKLQFCQGRSWWKSFIKNYTRQTMRPTANGNGHDRQLVLDSFSEAVDGNGRINTARIDTARLGTNGRIDTARLGTNGRIDTARLGANGRIDTA